MHLDNIQATFLLLNPLLDVSQLPPVPEEANFVGEANGRYCYLSGLDPWKVIGDYFDLPVKSKETT